MAENAAFVYQTPDGETYKIGFLQDRMQVFHIPRNDPPYSVFDGACDLGLTLLSYWHGADLEAVASATARDRHLWQLSNCLADDFAELAHRAHTIASPAIATGWSVNDRTIVALALRLDQLGNCCERARDALRDGDRALLRTALESVNQLTAQITSTALTLQDHLVRLN